MNVNCKTESFIHNCVLYRVKSDQIHIKNINHDTDNKVANGHILKLVIIHMHNKIHDCKTLSGDNQEMMG